MNINEAIIFTVNLLNIFSFIFTIITWLNIRMILVKNNRTPSRLHLFKDLGQMMDLAYHSKNGPIFKYHLIVIMMTTFLALLFLSIIARMVLPGILGNIGYKTSMLQIRLVHAI